MYAFIECLKLNIVCFIIIIVIIFRGVDDGSLTPVGLVLHSFGGELIILSLCKNGTLKLWSVQVTVLV